MPLLDSFCVDHVKMKAPGVRLAKTMKTPKGDDISVFDLRFCKPNEEILPEKGTHTLEHLFAGFMRDHLSPMGCRTGFYMSVIGVPSEEAVKAAWTASMKDILGVKNQEDIPELNKYQCGTYKMHSLDEAHAIASKILERGLITINNEEIALDVAAMGLKKH